MEVHAKFIFGIESPRDCATNLHIERTTVWGWFNGSRTIHDEWVKKKNRYEKKKCSFESWNIVCDTLAPAIYRLLREEKHSIADEEQPHLANFRDMRSTWISHDICTNRKKNTFGYFSIFDFLSANRNTLMLILIPSTP